MTLCMTRHQPNPFILKPGQAELLQYTLQVLLVQRIT